MLKLKILQRLRGTLIAVPVVNVYGFINNTRHLPDRRNLNRFSSTGDVVLSQRELRLGSVGVSLGSLPGLGVSFLAGLAAFAGSFRGRFVPLADLRDGAGVFFAMETSRNLYITEANAIGPS